MLKLTFDVTTGSLVAFQGSPAQLPVFRQGKQAVQIRLVRPRNAVIGDYVPDERDDVLGIRLGIWSNSTGTLDDSSDYKLALTPHNEFTYNEDDADDPYYEGNFDTLTTELATAMGSDKTYAGYFAVGYVRADLIPEPIYDHRGATNCTVYSLTDDASGALPTSVNGGIRYVTLPVYFKSADGARHYVLTENETQDGVVFSQYSP